MKDRDVDALLRKACAQRKAQAPSRAHTDELDYLAISRYVEGVACEGERRDVDALARTDADVAELLRPMEGTAPGSSSYVLRLAPRLFTGPLSRTLLRCAAVVALLVSTAWYLGHSLRAESAPAAAHTGLVTSADRVLVFRGVQCPYSAQATNVCEVMIRVDAPVEDTQVETQ